MNTIHTAQQYCTFEVDNALFGVDVKRVQEVLKAQDLTPVPLAPPTIAGLMNLRGQIVLTLDLRHLLGLPPRPDNTTANVVLRSDDGPISLLVDSIDGVVEPSPDCYEDPPETTQANVRTFLTHICKLDGRLLHILDPEQLINITPS